MTADEDDAKTMSERLTQLIADLDARHARAPMEDAIPIECDSDRDFYQEVTGVLQRRPHGVYAVRCVYQLDADALLVGLDQGGGDAGYDRAWELLQERAGDVGWFIPRGDPLYRAELLHLVMSDGPAPG